MISAGRKSNPFELQSLENVANTSFSDFDFNKLVELADWLKILDYDNPLIIAKSILESSSK